MIIEDVLKSEPVKSLAKELGKNAETWYKERSGEFQEQKKNYNMDSQDYSVFDKLINVTKPFYAKRHEAHEDERRKLDRFKGIFNTHNIDVSSVGRNQDT